MKRWSYAGICLVSVALMLGVSGMALAGANAPAAQTAADSLPRISTKADVAGTRVALPTHTDTSARALTPFAVVVGLGAAGGLCTLIQSRA